MRRSLLGVLGALLLAAPAALGQTRVPRPLPDISGTWQAETPDGPKDVVVRPDSSASFGEETVRWRLAPGVLYIAFGDEWVGYTLALKGKTMTLSDGDLEEPVALKWVGPSTPRPQGVDVPPAPPFPPGTSR